MLKKFKKEVVNMNIEKIKSEKIYYIHNMKEREFDEELEDGIYRFSLRNIFYPTNVIVNPSKEEYIKNRFSFHDKKDGIIMFSNVNIIFSNDISENEILLYLDD